ncbi:MAG: agmatine deiminase family protein [Thermoplasmatota archaeon]
MNATPRSLGYRMPAEWAPHAATWLAWPHDPLTWPDRVEKAEEVFRQMIAALAPNERVELLVKDAATRVKVEAWLASEAARGHSVPIGSPVKHWTKNVRLHDWPTADSWIRDYGPSFVVSRTVPPDPPSASPAASSRTALRTNPKLAGIDWRFNAWGDKYETLKRDDAIPEKIVPFAGARLFQPDLVMEGGSFDVNGEGDILTTEQCLLNVNRNPKMSRDELEFALKDNLGVERVWWLGAGIEGDDTDGHVDDIARFVAPKTVLAAVADDERDENHEPLRQNLERIRSWKKFDVIEFPMPGAIVSDEDDRPLPASYANFYIANGVVLAPVFGDPNDPRALAVLAKVFPARRIVPIRCEDFVYGMGAIHCVTQQEPKTQ